MSHPLSTLHSRKEWQKGKTITYLPQPETYNPRLQRDVPKHYWREALLTATHLINKVLSRVLRLKSPMKVLFNFYPDLTTTNQLVPKIFGCMSFIHIHSQNRWKLYPSAVKCVFFFFFFSLLVLFNPKGI